MNNNLINIKNENGNQLVSARELHDFLESKQDFTTWIKSKVEKYDFLENIDFTFHKFMEGKVWKHDYVLKIEMAKELSMVESNEKGKEARKYFIACEKLLKNDQPKLSKEVQAIFVLDKRTVEMDNRLIVLEGSMTIDYSQQEELRTTANKKIVEILGGKDAPAYKECSKKAFSELWKAFKRIVQVNSYRNTAAKEYEYAKDVINNWEPNRDLELMILGANSQFKIKL